MISAQKLVVSCESYHLEEHFWGTCFGHVFPKTCQYGTTNEKVCKNWKYVFIESAQENL
jgi:hypothetical protein